MNGMVTRKNKIIVKEAKYGREAMVSKGNMNRQNQKMKSWKQVEVRGTRRVDGKNYKEVLKSGMQENENKDHQDMLKGLPSHKKKGHNCYESKFE